MYILNVNDIPDAMALSVCRLNVVWASSRPHFCRSADLYIIFASSRNSPTSRIIQIY
ncbi:hypothetical protein MA16_Dca004549 [Dendrobium catenatum]|uniref:Uncharacterized protein n=1 Tax=Dendrobium catenatum TaxID=906689 RepID=A0A2I0VNF2_9ASPA|nr:hypothetical protein MA16_Dca004549 [Dendrobium catenatum]